LSRLPDAAFGILVDHGPLVGALLREVGDALWSQGDLLLALERAGPSGPGHDGKTDRLGSRIDRNAADSPWALCR
jgi:hypothetical protein